MAGEGLTYDDVFERQGIDPELRRTDSFFMYTVTKNDGPNDQPSGHAGEVYAIPRELSYEDREGFKGSYTLREDGTMVSHEARIDSDSEVGGRSVVHRGAALRKASTIGAACVVGTDARIKGSRVWDRVSIGSGSRIEDSRISRETQIGKNVTIGSGSTLHKGVVIDDGARLDSGNSISEAVKIGKNAVIRDRAILREGVQVDEAAHVGQGATVRQGARILGGAKVADGKTVRPNNVVISSQYKRARKSD